MKIYVDADACSVVHIVEKIAKKYQVPVTLLCDTNHGLSSKYSEVLLINGSPHATGTGRYVADAYPCKKYELFDEEHCAWKRKVWLAGKRSPCVEKSY